MNHHRLRLASALTVGISFTLFAGLARVSAAVIFVSADAIGNDDGTSWENAFPDLQDALAASEGGDQIWVGAATYKPAGPQGDRTATFQLISGVGLYGGFAGDETEIDQRDPDVNVTILSGDLNGNDGEDFANNDENVYHVVTGSETDATTVLDGFTITGGNADNGAYHHLSGGGMYTSAGNPTVVGCRFIGNAARSGGGMYYRWGTQTVVDCFFLGNSARDGGGLLVSSDVLTVLNCVFIDNSATNDGGGLRSSSAILTVVNCMFIGNSAEDQGGGLYQEGGVQHSVINSNFSRNTAENYGGGLFIESGTLNNCILWENADGSGSEESGQLTGSQAAVSYSCIQGLDSFAGNGNIADDPLFIDPVGPDGVPGTQDDDLRLGPGSPCIDAADNESVPADEFDLDGDGDTSEPIPMDLDGRLRFVDDPATDDTGNGTSPIVDMGPSEFQIQDSPCEGDANGDGLVDPLDSGFVLARFGCPVGTGDPSCDAADQNGDGLVDPLDSGFVLARFGECP